VADDGEVCVTNLGHVNSIVIKFHNGTNRMDIEEVKHKVDQDYNYMSGNKGSIDSFIRTNATGSLVKTAVLSSLTIPERRME
jgi:hypothetical protein